MIGPDPGGTIWAIFIVEREDMPGRWRAITDRRAEVDEIEWVSEEFVTSRDNDTLRELDAQEWEDEPEQIEVRRSKRDVVSFRLPHEEAEQLIAAAKQAGETLSEFIRGAIAIRVHGTSFGPAVRITSGSQGQTWSVTVQSYLLAAPSSTRDDDENWRLVPDAPPNLVNVQIA